MKVHVPKETKEGETRIPLVPASVKKLAAAGVELTVEKGIGEAIGIPDSEYGDAGATVAEDGAAALAAADVVLRLCPPAELGPYEGKTLVCPLDPFTDHDRVKALAAGKVKAYAMDMMPRTTIAQKMDVISSQANLAGYKAVLIAAERMSKILPMMSTPAGTIKPARVFIIGVGVAGLQAIATARRLGAIVMASDTRAATEEQVKSLGAKFFKPDLGETGATKDGYAKELTPEQQQLQREALKKTLAEQDVIITTAKLFGRPAPRIITEEMLAEMKAGTVIVDLAAESGGNVAGAKPGEEVVTDNGVRIIGVKNLPGATAVPASEVFSSNLANFILHFWDKEAKTFNPAPDEEHAKGTLITDGGEIVHDFVREIIQKAESEG